jgi:hypothetical protein
MFDAQCDLAALVYEQHEDPDRVLRDFAADLNAYGHRAVGLVQTSHYCLDAPGVCTKNSIRVDGVMESPKLAE